MDDEPVTQDAVVWAANRTVAMHRSDQDGPTGRCKQCPPEGSEYCKLLYRAKLDVLTAGLPHPHT